MKFRILDPAAREYRNAVHYYRSIRPDLASRFQAAFNACVDRILVSPAVGELVSGGVRVGRLKRFRYAIVYLERSNELIVVAVMHLHRRPGYWKSRLKDVGQ